MGQNHFGMLIRKSSQLVWQINENNTRRIRFNLCWFISTLVLGSVKRQKPYCL